MFKKIVCFILVLCFAMSIPVYASNDTYSMKTSEALINLIKYYEGFSSTVMADSSGYAIGYGTHCSDISDYPDGITEEEADELLRDIVSGMEDKVNAMAEKMGITLSQNQFDALISLTYNLGSSWMSSDYSLYNMLANGIENYSDGEIINTFGKYCHVGGKVVPAIAWRRLTEAKIFLYSDYKTGGTQNYEYDLVNDPSIDTDILFQAEGSLTICRYADISYVDWFYKYLSPLTYTGVFQGYEDSTFRPDNYVTCGETLKLVILAAGYDEQAPTGEHWASGYLTFAEENAIVVRGDITDLDAPISRLLLAEIAANALRLSLSTITPFSDTDNGYVLALYNAGIITGSYNEAGQLVYLPADNLRRCEICAVIWRIENCY